MPSTKEAIEVFHANNIIYAPGKAANAGGVAVSGLEMSQNAQLATWSHEKVDQRLKDIMHNIYIQSAEAAKEYGFPGHIQHGANISSFLKVSNAMIQQGAI